VNLSYQDLGRRRTETTSEWVALSYTVIECAVVEWRQCLRACVRAEVGHKDDDVTRDFLRDTETIAASHVCRYSVSLIIQIYS